MGGLHISDDKIHEEMVKLFRREKLDRLQAEFLLDRGADINHLDGTGSAALHYCTKNRDWNNLHWLHDHGADMALGDRFGNTPLHTCVMLNYIDLAEWFLNVTASAATEKVHYSSRALHINIKNNIGVTPVHVAAQTVHLEKQVEWIKALGGDFNARTHAGWRPIDFAIQRAKDDNADVEKAKSVLEAYTSGLPGVGIKGAKADSLKGDFSELNQRRLARQGSIKVLGAEKAGFHDTLDPFSWREDSLNAPLKRKPKGPSIKVGQKKFVLKGAEHAPYKKLKRYWWSDDPPPQKPPLPLVIDAARFGQNPLTEALLSLNQQNQHPDGFDARGDNGKTALCYAVGHGHVKIAKNLMDAGADPYDVAGKMARWQMELEFTRKKRAVRRAARDERNRKRILKMKEEAKLREEAERQRREAAAREHERKWGKNHHSALHAQLYELHPKEMTNALSDKANHPVTARIIRMNRELKEDPLQFLAAQNLVEIDKLLEHLLRDRLDPNTSASGIGMRSDPSWPPVERFGIPNLAWRVRDCRRVLAKLATSHRISRGYFEGFSKMESKAMPKARRRVRHEKPLGKEDLHDIYADSEEEKSETDSDDEVPMTNVMLKML